jgi:hypothetical protein
MSVIIRGLNEDKGKAQSVLTKENNLKTFEDLKNYIYKNFAVNNEEELNFSTNGRNLKLSDLIPETFAIYDVKTMLRGGKGGFGSLLKGQPPVKKRTSNTDSCRDLSGRRMRHVNQEKMIKEWQQKKIEEEKLLKMYNNPNEEENVKDYIDSDKRKEVLRLNKKYLFESVETTESVSDSIKFLLKKQKRDGGIENKNNIIEKVEIKKIDYAIKKEETKKNKINNISNIFDVTAIQDKNINELEDQLFSLD